MRAHSTSALALVLVAYAARAQEAEVIAVAAPPGIVGYAVDSINGTDLGGANSCAVKFTVDMSVMVRGTPCKTISRLLASSPPNGSTIFVKRGSYFREDLNLAGRTNLTVTAYGPTVASPVDDLGRALPAEAGDRPMFDAASVVSNASFSKTVGRTHVYEIAETLAAGLFHGIYEAGTRLVRVADVATVDATPGSYTAPIGSSGGAETVYFHPAASDDPATNGKVYELRKRIGIVSCAGCSLISLSARRNSNPNGSILSYHYARDCVALDGNKHNFWVNGLCEDCVAKYNEKPDNYGGSTLFVTYPSTLYPNPSHTQGAVYRRCTAIGEDDGYTMGFYAHTSGGGVAYDRIIYDGASASHLAAGFGSGGEIDYVVYRNCTTSVVGAYTPAPTVATVVLGGCSVLPGSNSTGGGISNNPGSNPQVIVRGWSAFSDGGNVTFVQANGSSTLNMSRSTIAHYGAAQFSASVRALAGNTASFSLDHNVFYGGWQHYDPAAGNTVASSDWNLFYGGTNLNTGTPTHYDNWRMAGAQYTGFSTYRAAFPALDANSQSANPQFAGDPSACDMSVAGGSPAVTLGAGSIACASDPTCVSLWETYSITPTGWIGPGL